MVLCFLVASTLMPCGHAAEPRPPIQVMVAYYSLSTSTEQMAQGVVEGVKRVPGAVASLKKIEEVSTQDLTAADAIILGCPTYYGSIPGKMKVDFTV